MKPSWMPWGKEEPPPIESAGKLEAIAHAGCTATAMQQIHLHLTLETKAARSLRGALERDGKRVSGPQDHGRLLTSYCIDVSQIDLQKYTGSLRPCSCDAFEQPR
jgi:hypothetical protein